MDMRDRAFIHDICQFTYLNHMATVHMLRDNLSKTKEIAKSTVGAFREYNSDDEVIWDAKRIMLVIAARIYAENISALEDLGALGVAVRKRASGGICKKYLEYEPREVKKFYQYLHDDPNITPVTLLQLPPISEITQVRPDKLDLIKQSYAALSENLNLAAQVYSQRDSDTQVIEGNSPPQEYVNDVNIILDIQSAQSPLKEQRNSRIVQGYNKIKHGFMVTENLAAYYDPSSTDRVTYGRFGLTPRFLEQMCQNTQSISLTIAELASLIRFLDEEGLLDNIQNM